MKKIFNHTIILVAIFVLVGFTKLSAEDLYIGTGVGMSANVKNNLGKKFNEQNNISTRSGYAANVFIGYNIDENFAIEVGYKHFIKHPYKRGFNGDAISLANDSDLTAEDTAILKADVDSTDKLMKVSANNVNLNAVLKTTFADQHTILGSLGIGVTRINLSVRDSNNTQKQTLNTIEYLAGAGYEFAITKNHSVGLKSSISFMPKLTSKNKEEKKTEKVERFKSSANADLGMYYKFTF